MIVVSSPNPRLERSVRGQRGCAANALRHFALASHWARVRPAVQPHR